jgi:hypothetical protein
VSLKVQSPPQPISLHSHGLSFLLSYCLIVQYHDDEVITILKDGPGGRGQGRAGRRRTRRGRATMLEMAMLNMILEPIQVFVAFSAVA